MTLEPTRCPCALMGGLSLAFWKHVRSTRDVDIIARELAAWYDWKEAGPKTQREGATMEKALGTFHNGRVEFDHPVHWPDGTRLEVVPAIETTAPDSAEEIAEWLEWFKSIEPFEMTADELAAFEVDLKASKETQKELLRKSWAKEDHP